MSSTMELGACISRLRREGPRFAGLSRFVRAFVRVCRGIEGK